MSTRRIWWTCCFCVALCAVGFLAVVPLSALPLEVEDTDRLSAADGVSLVYLRPLGQGFGFAEGSNGRDGMWMVDTRADIEVVRAAQADQPALSFRVEKPSCLSTQTAVFDFLLETSEVRSDRVDLGSTSSSAVVSIPPSAKSFTVQASQPGCVIPPDVRPLVLRIAPNR